MCEYVRCSYVSAWLCDLVASLFACHILQVVSVGSELVLSLDDFKAALKMVKDKNKAGSASLMVRVTLSSSSDRGSNLKHESDGSADRVGAGQTATKQTTGFCDDGINVEVMIRR